MAQVLDFSPLDRRQEIYNDRRLKAELTESLINTAVSTAMDVASWQKEMRQKFKEASEFDDDITMDSQFNSWASKRFDDNVKNSEVEAIKNKKWKTSDHINKMLAVKKQTMREVESGKYLLQSLQEARQKASENSMLYDVDTEKVNKFQNFIRNGGGEGVNNPNAFFQSFMQGDNGESPFLKLRENDVDPVLTNIALNLGKEFDEIEKVTRQSIVGDKLVSTVSEKRQINEVVQDKIGELVWNELVNDKNQQKLLATYGLNASNKIKNAGMASTGNLDDLRRYVYDVMDYNAILKPTERVVSRETKPYEKKESTSKKEGPVTINKTDIGWDFGTTSIDIDKDVTYTENGKERKVSLRNSPIIGVREADGGYVARISIPVDKEVEQKAAIEEFESNRIEENKQKEKAAIDARTDISERKKSRLKKRVDKNVGLTDEDIAESMSIESSVGASKVIEVPLDKSLHQELKSAFDKRKLNVVGFNDIKFDGKKEKEVKEEKSETKYSSQQESGIQRFMEANNLSREEAIKILKDNGRL